MSDYAKLKITAILEIRSGLHIGASNAFASIGATDSPVIKDPLTNRPVIPGSSIKGKMRTLLAKAYNSTVANNPNDDADIIKRLFGATNPNTITGKLVFRDLVLSDAENERLHTQGAQSLTEVKFENTINRKTAEANPRQIERVIRGSRFEFELIYEVSPNSDGASPSPEDIKQDFELVVDGLKLLELDYLGGHGTRGYGGVTFKDAKVQLAYGTFDDALLSNLNTTLSEAL